MPGGVYKQPAAATGASAEYRGETKPKHVSAPSFKAVSMSAKLLAGIVPISDQLLRWAPSYLREWVQDDLRQALAQTMDTAMYRGVGTEYTPRGIFNIPGVYKIDAGGNNAPTIQEIEALAAKLELRMMNANVPILRPQWRMSYDLLMYLQNLRDGLGNRYFPELSNGTPRWRNKPVMATTNMPNNLGDTTDAMELALIDFGHVLYGETLGMQLATSNEATVIKPDGQAIHAFQDNVTLFRAEMEHDVDVRYPEAVAVAENIRWGREDL
jgi:HK97 family phage major capsid protein